MATNNKHFQYVPRRELLSQIEELSARLAKYEGKASTAAIPATNNEAEISEAREALSRFIVTSLSTIK